LELNGGTLRWKLIKSKGPSINNLFLNTDIRAANLLILPGTVNRSLPAFIQEDFSYWLDQQVSSSINLTTLSCPLDLSWYGGTFYNKLVSREDLTFFLLPFWAFEQIGLNTVVPVLPVSSLLAPLSLLLVPFFPFSFNPPFFF